MKKATIIITVLSILVSMTTLLVIKKTDKIVNDTSLVTEITTSVEGADQSLENKINDASDDYTHYFEEIALSQKQYLEVNECMQFYIKEESFANANNCQEMIVDVVVQDYGELGIIKSIIGDMLIYASTGAYLNLNYVKNLIISCDRKTYLKEKLILTFVNRFRDPVKLQSAFSNHKAYLFNFISKDVYDKVYNEYINTFISSYHDIHKNKDVEAFYKDIYFKAEKFNKQDEYWFYTFWKRRELEKNDQVIYSILNEINTHYNN